MGGSFEISSCSDTQADTQPSLKMKVLALIVLIASTASAFVVLPKGAQVKTIKQCEGFDGPMKLIDGEFPEPISLPSQVPLNFKTEVAEDLPADLVIFMKLPKLTPTHSTFLALMASAL